MTRRAVRWLVCAGVVIASAGCGDDGGAGAAGPISGSTKGQIEIEAAGGAVEASQSAPITLSKAELAVGEAAVTTVRVRNVATNGDLQVTVSFHYTAPPVEEADGPSLAMAAARQSGADVALEGGVASTTLRPFQETGEELELDVRFLRYDDSRVRTGALHIDSDTRLAAEQQVVLTFRTEEGLPVANVSPAVIDFGEVGAGHSPTQPLLIANTGSDPLRIQSVLLQAHPDFSLGAAGGTWFEPGEDIRFEPELVVAPNAVQTFLVRFAPQTPAAATGKLVVYTNDPAHPSGIVVALQANTAGACITVNPKKVLFGPKVVGKTAELPVEIGNDCSGQLEVLGISLAEGSSQAFTLQMVDPPSAEAPWVLGPNEVATVHVRYVAALESPLGDDGQIIGDTGLLVIESNAFDDLVELEVGGMGVGETCPTAVGTISEGESAIPQTTLHLFGDQSWAPGSEVAGWEWSVIQPPGSVTAFVPSDTFPNPTFQVNAAGEYRFSLEVEDATGEKSCNVWKASVLVIPDEAIHVELLWHTPNDPDETDEGPEAGTDVDLHFQHAAYASGPDVDGDGAPDGWFGMPFDTFWFNAHPDWGSADPSLDDDPGLDRDDTDGGGPENLNLNIPEATTYRIGVHYWDDHEYGPSYATVRVYIYGNMVLEASDVKLVSLDLWEVATISWPSGKVSPVVTPEGEHRVTPNYPNPFAL